MKHSRVFQEETDLISHVAAWRDGEIEVARSETATVHKDLSRTDASMACNFSRVRIHAEGESETIDQIRSITAQPVPIRFDVEQIRAAIDLAVSNVGSWLDQ